MLSPGGGLSQYVLSLCEFLAREHDVYVLLTHNGSDIHWEQSQLRSISTNIKLITLGTECKFGKYLKTIKLIWSIRPNIIINNFNAVVQYILPFIPTKIKKVHILHSDDQRYYQIGAINAKMMNGWIAPTQAVADNFDRYTQGAYRDKVVVIPHGVASAVPSAKKEHSEVEILYAGVLYEHKGVKTLPAIVRRLEEEHIDFHFTVVGGGVLADWLAEQFQDEIASGVIEMTGVIPHEEVYQRMSQADIFLYPTHLDSFGLVIAEAMMNGAVPVVTHLPGITDNLIRDTIDGYLVDKDDIEGFSSSIVRLARDKRLLSKLSNATHQRAVTTLSMEQMQVNYTNYFRTL